MSSSNGGSHRDRWARLRFAIVGPLLASPPPAGQLRAEFERLSQRDWEHPSGRGPVRFAVSTIERWYYQARAEERDPVKALRRKPRADIGRDQELDGPAIVLEDACTTLVPPSWTATVSARGHLVLRRS